MTSDPGLILGDDGKHRCWWGSAPKDYRDYHDTEWGAPVFDDQRLFEKICLEGFQSGLSWLTILRKRENFRAAFCGFNFHEVARFGEHEVCELLQDAGIVRHRGKIEATITNAKCALEMTSEFGSLSNYFWRHQIPEEERPTILDRESLSGLAHTPSSKLLSKDLRKRGWRYVGPTTAYAFMQAMGLVNDHLEGCFIRDQITSAQKKARLK